MQPALPKPVKKKLAELVCSAHEKALRQELLKLQTDFDRWQRGEIDSFDLADLIHKFHDGPSREIYKQFSYTRNADLPMIAAYAIQARLLDAADIPSDAVPYVDDWLGPAKRPGE